MSLWRLYVLFAVKLYMLPVGISSGMVLSIITYGQSAPGPEHLIYASKIRVVVNVVNDIRVRLGARGLNCRY